MASLAAISSEDSASCKSKIRCKFIPPIITHILMPDILEHDTLQIKLLNQLFYLHKLRLPTLAFCQQIRGRPRGPRRAAPAHLMCLVSVARVKLRISTCKPQALFDNHQGFDGFRLQAGSAERDGVRRVLQYTVRHIPYRRRAGSEARRDGTEPV
ncbi:hypothetical protein DFH09DRAFT_1129007 [Mycena vulgaris]|nr:hypothetical protein DFH09DRAFT_1129007 [Mycena vulgaris]